jgi:hypothetical protein
MLRFIDIQVEKSDVEFGKAVIASETTKPPLHVCSEIPRMPPG